MKYSFSSEVERYNKENPREAGGDWFRFVEGPNKLRVLSQGEIIAEHFKLGVCYGMEKGCPFHTPEFEKTPARPKWLMWIIDRNDKGEKKEDDSFETPNGKIKLAKMPYTIIQAIGELQKSEDFSFDEVPMPYDITINAKGAGTKEVVYTILPSPNKIPLTEEEVNSLASQKTVEEIVQKMKDKQRAKIDADPMICAQRAELERELKASSKSLSNEEETIEYPDDDIKPGEIPF